MSDELSWIWLKQTDMQCYIINAEIKINCSHCSIKICQHELGISWDLTHLILSLCHKEQKLKLAQMMAWHIKSERQMIWF